MRVYPRTFLNMKRLVWRRKVDATSRQEEADALPLAGVHQTEAAAAGLPCTKFIADRAAPPSGAPAYSRSCTCIPSKYHMSCTHIYIFTPHLHTLSLQHILCCACILSNIIHLHLHTLTTAPGCFQKIIFYPSKLIFGATTATTSRVNFL